MRRLLLFLTLFLAAPAAGQDALDAAARRAVVDDLIAKLHAGYVFPKKAVEAETALRERLERGEYESYGQPTAFAERLTSDLQDVTHDRHLRVRPRPAAAPPASGPQSQRPDPATAIGAVEILDGNVGYVEIRSFGFPPDIVRDLVRDAMTQMADADALIVDVRRNGGGDPGFVALVSSYLFDEEPVHLNSLYFRPSDDTTHFHTDPGVAGRKFGGTKPVYVLTSGRTFSAAEEFTYNLQTRERATIVGETTGGGAHPGGVRDLPHGMSVFVPSGRAINPITGTNWEGTGVRPDVPVPADDALEEALRRARAQIVAVSAT